jgi:peptide chain release factor
MMAKNTDLWLQISAGHGPAECAWAVVKVLEQMQGEAPAHGLELKTIEVEPGPKPGTAQSALVSISGAAGVEAFASSWSGTIQFTARSPFRPEHKRKNWFVGIDAIEPVDETSFRAQDVRWETMRATGPGGQHVNRTESGVQATAMEERSQHRNRKLALARLAKKLAEMNAQRQDDVREKRWRAHQDLQRGNPVRTIY